MIQINWVAQNASQLDHLVLDRYVHYPFSVNRVVVGGVGQAMAIGIPDGRGKSLQWENIARKVILGCQRSRGRKTKRLGKLSIPYNRSCISSKRDWEKADLTAEIEKTGEESQGQSTWKRLIRKNFNLGCDFLSLGEVFLYPSF